MIRYSLYVYLGRERLEEESDNLHELLLKAREVVRSGGEVYLIDNKENRRYDLTKCFN